MPKGPAQQYASDYTDRIEEQLGKGLPLLPIHRATMQGYLEIAFHAGFNHAAAQYMEMKAGNQPEEPPFQASTIAVDNPEREHLNALMDQVAREAIASVNETAASEHDYTLIVFRNGDWINLQDERLDHWKTPVSRLKIKHYDTAEDLADALRAAIVSA